MWLGGLPGAWPEQVPPPITDPAGGAPIYRVCWIAPLEPHWCIQETAPLPSSLPTAASSSPTLISPASGSVVEPAKYTPPSALAAAVHQVTNAGRIDGFCHWRERLESYL